MNVWVDIDNAPHVLVLRPIMTWLTQAGHAVHVTARDYGQTLPLLRFYGIPHRKVGTHAGANKVRKVLSLASRTAALLPLTSGARFQVALSHGTRAVLFPARAHGIPLVYMGDYEHGVVPRFMLNWATVLLVPEVIPDDVLERKGMDLRRVRKFPGLKEELYVYDCDPDPTILSDLGIDTARPVVLVRPPASMAHYHVAEGDRLFHGVLEYLGQRRQVQVILLPRTSDQRAETERWLQSRAIANVIIPQKVYHGPDLVHYADVVISGGGTMNREAACMGKPVYSIFRGPLGAVDRHLIQAGKLRQLTSPEMLDDVPLTKTAVLDLESRRPLREKLVRFVGELVVGAARGQ